MPLNPPPLAALLLAVAMAMAATSPTVVAGSEVRATVLSIGDGDTIRVQQGQQRITVRLACIDAPEMVQAPYGANSRAYLQTRLRIGTPVTLLPQAVVVQLEKPATPPTTAALEAAGEVLEPRRASHGPWVKTG